MILISISKLACKPNPVCIPSDPNPVCNIFKKIFLSVAKSMCANGTDLNWMHVYPESVPKEKVRAGKPAKDNSNTMAVK